MKKTTTLLFALFLGISTSNAQTYEWAKSIGGTSMDEGRSIFADDLGNVYTTGFFRGTADFDPGVGTSNLTSSGGEDIFILKLDPAGNFLWAKSFGASLGDMGHSIAVDGSGNVYATGYFQGTVDFDPGAGTSSLTSFGEEDIFILKLDAAGNFLWAKSMGGTGWDESYSIAVDDSGNVYTTGWFENTVDFDPGLGNTYLASAGGTDFFILKLDTAGNFLWARRIGNTSFELCYSIAVDDWGNVYTTGSFGGISDFDPGPGTFNLTGFGASDVFILKLDAAGNFVWAKCFRGTSFNGGNSIAVDDFGNVYTTGYFAGNADFDPGAGTVLLASAGSFDIFISKLDVDGNYLWAKGIGGTSQDEGRSIAVDNSGNVYTTGHFTWTVDFDPGAGMRNLTNNGWWDVFISKLDAEGNFIRAHNIGWSEEDNGHSIAVDGSGNVYTTGRFGGLVEFGLGGGFKNRASGGSRYIVSAGYDDAYILKLGIANIGIMENNFGHSLTLYPNPTYGDFSIDLGMSYDEVTVVIRNLLGQEVFTQSFTDTNTLQLNIPGAAGMYFIEVNSGNKKAIVKVVKE
jgi:hypothetical protein